VKNFHQLAKLISLEGFPLFYWYHTQKWYYTLKYTDVLFHCRQLLC